MEKTPDKTLFTLKKARQTIQLVEDAWNSKDLYEISAAYSFNIEWHYNDSIFVKGHKEILEFLSFKWENEQEYKLKMKYWAHTDNSIAVRFKCEYKNEFEQWYRAYGIETWEFNINGFIQKRFIRINFIAIKESERLLGLNLYDFVNLSRLLKIE